MLFTKDDIQTMTATEKFELLDILWDCIEEENYVDDAGEESINELQLLRERLEEYKTNPSAGIEWQELKNELLKRSGE